MTFFPKKQAVILLLLVLALAIFFRFYKLAAIPPGLYPDVAINGNDALETLKNKDFKSFYPENNGREGLFINMIALAFWLFGPSVFVMKLLPAFFGSLTVLAIYFLAKELFAYKGKLAAQFIALAASFFLAVSLWHNIFSRIPFRAILAPLLLTWSFYFLLKSLRSAKTLPAFFWAAGAGILAGLGFQTYIAFRVAPLVFVPLFIFCLWQVWPKIKSFNLVSWFKNVYLADGFWKWDVFLALVIVVFLPLGIYYLTHPADFIGRAGQVSVWAYENPVKQLLWSTIKTLGQFNIVGDFNWRHNLSGSPQLFLPVGILFLVGFFFSWRQIFQLTNYRSKNFENLTAHFTLLVWWGVMLLPSILTAEGIPHALRTITAIIPTYILAGLGLWWVYQKIKNKISKKNLIILGLVFALLVGGAEFYRLFFLWGQNQETKGAFTQRFVNEANYLNSLPANVKKYVIVNEHGVPVPWPDGIPMPAQTIIFLTRIHQPETEVEYLKTEKISQLPNCPIVILPMKYEENLFNQLKSKFPSGNVETKGEFAVFKLNF